ncbi:MAG TPA: maleylacetoacetate isomerase [bacterium]|nr:maleylacetoacetate isomerase [bacterium]
MILYTYSVSSAAFRVRIALNLKGIQPEFRYVHLRRNGGEHLTPQYAKLNPQREVPTLVDGDRVIAQSMAIMEYLEETHPEPPLLPKDPYARAKTRQVCEAVVSGIHPLGNLKVLQFLEHHLRLPEEDRVGWYHHWVGVGAQRLEELVAPLAGQYCVGDQVSLADCCVIPQVYNCIRRQVDMSECPTLKRLWDQLSPQPAFAKAMPEKQWDFGQ